MLFNDVVMTSLVHNYVDHGPISIPTRFQTNTPNNKVATVEGGGGWGAIPHQHGAKNSLAWISAKNNLAWIE